MPVVVGLHKGEIGTDPLVVDFVLHVGEQNESGDNTLTTGALDLARDLAVPDVVVVGEQSTNTLGRHSHDQVSVLGLGLAGVGPIGGRGISKVLVLGDGIVEVVPGVGLALTHGHRGTRVKREGGQRVATTETVGAGTTLSVFCGQSVICPLTHSKKVNSREQQGYFSSLHWLLVLQDWAASAVTDNEARTKGVTKRTMMN